uniref:Coilin tudor domain-containing protein n=1 Tax=Brassica campestris TaxID=3711 RepID=M4DTG1_BRACM
MEPEKVRVRLSFEDQRVLSKSQKKQGLKRSWVVLDPKCHRTVSEFSDHLLHTFCLFEACPHGISLSMDGFVLPPFESSCVLKDKDIVCVKRKKEPLLEIVEEDSEENVCAEIEAEERAPGVMLLANEEFQKETGGYESESEEDELEEIVPVKKTSKKRKASSKSTSSKRKKCKLATTEESPLERESEAVVSKGSAVKKRKTSDAQRTENDQQDEVKAKSMTKSKKSSKQAESKEPNEQCNVSGEAKKTPSRSARRKKAKRQWLREKTKQEKEEYLQLKQKQQMVVAPNQKPAFTINHQVTKENRSEALEPQQPDENGDGVGDEVVPVEVRPGHIRFEPLDETDQASAEEIAPPAEKFVWNGNMTKKKGQKWGTEKAGLSKRYAQDMDEDTYQTQSAEAETLAKGQIDFEQLVAYSGSVKKGDVIAYRLIELTSSWTPEVSSFRVGKISYYDPESKKVTLMPVEEYPIEKKTEEDTDDSSMQPDTSLYKEDGSLEIEFSSLLDVRCIKTTSSNNSEVARSAPLKPVQTATNPKLSSDNGLQTPVKENGKGDPWEELSNALSAKKAQLAQANNGGWNNKKGSSSGGSAWSYKALRGSGMGPVMKYLRSQNEI